MPLQLVVTLSYTFIFIIYNLSYTGIARDRWHKRRATGGRMAQLRKKRKFELGRPPSNTKVLFQIVINFMLEVTLHAFFFVTGEDIIL